MLIPVRKFYARKENSKKLSYAVLLTGQDITSYNNTSFVLFFYHCIWKGIAHVGPRIS